MSALYPLCNDSDELLPFELDSFLDYTSVDVKVSVFRNLFPIELLKFSQIPRHSLFQHQQQEENNNNQPNQSEQNFIDAANILSNRSSGDRQSQHNDLMDLMALAASNSLSRSSLNNNENSRSAANPLLAEKLLSPSLSVLDALTIGSAVGVGGGGGGSSNSGSIRSGRPPDMKGK